MEQKDLEQIGAVVAKGLEPVVADVKALGTSVAELTTRMDTQEKALKDEVHNGSRHTLDGLRIALGQGVVVRGAPAFVRPGALGDKPYSIGAAIRAMLGKNWNLAPLESHISEELAKNGYASFRKNEGLLIPLTHSEVYLGENPALDSVRALIADCMPVQADPYEVSRLIGASGRKDLKAMDPLDDTAGGSYIPFPERGAIIELLRAATMFDKLGVQQVPLPPGGLDYPKETSATSFGWPAPNTNATESTPNSGSVKLTPKEMSGIVKLPNSLIRFSAGAAEAVIRRALALDAAITADQAYLIGTGGTLQPTGLLGWEQSAADTPTRDKVTLHVTSGVATNGNTFQPEDPNLMISLVEEAPDAEGANGFLMYPRMWAVLKNKRADQGSGAGTGAFMFPEVARSIVGGGGMVPKEIASLPVVTSTLVPKNRYKGTAHGTLTVIVCANWRRMTIGRLGVLELAMSTDAGFAANQTWLRATMYTDSALLLPESFVVCDQLLLS